jgi:hypothetical protein
MKRLVVASTLSLAAFMFAPREVHACSCMKTPPALEAARGVDVVFHGKLVSVREVPASGQYGLDTKIFTFDVVRTFKGQLDAQVNVETAAESAACGRAYGDPGSEWLIYARVDDQGRTRDGLCSRTMAIDAAAADIAELEANADTLDQEPEAPETPGPADPEPEPVLPQDDDGGAAADGPEPAEPGKKGCTITEGEKAGEVAGLLALGCLFLGLRRAGRRSF